MCSNFIHRDGVGAGANVCDSSSSEATHDLPAQQYTPTNLSNKFSESTTTITTNTTEEQESEKLADPMRQELLRTTSEDDEDLSESRQTGVSSAENSFASAARGLGECERITTCARTLLLLLLGKLEFLGFNMFHIIIRESNVNSIGPRSHVCKRLCTNVFQAQAKYSYGKLFGSLFFLAFIADNAVV